MKRLAFFFTLLIVICGLGGCGDAGGKEQSAFKASFSLGSIVEANAQVLADGPRVSSGTEVGPSEPFMQKHEEMIVHVDSTNGSSFMEAIRSSVEEALTSSGAKILGRSGDVNQGPGDDPADSTGFSLSYREDTIYGVVNVWGVRGEDTKFILIVLITESQDA
jgi:hypothetical protein